MESGRTNTVVATEAVCLHRLAEIERAIGEANGLKRSPYWIGQIGAGFDQDRNIGRASDVKSKLIALHSKNAVLCLDNRIP